MVEAMFRPQISILEKIKQRHSIQRPRKSPYPKFRPKSTKFQKVDQNRSLRNSRIDRFDTKYQFSRQTSTAIRFSALENPHKQSLVKNRPSFKKSTKIDQKIDNSIDTDRKISKFEKPRPCASSTFYKLSYEPKITKFGSGVGELWLAEKSVTGVRVHRELFCPYSSKQTRSARYARFASENSPSGLW